MFGFGGNSFDPDRDIPDLSGKTILVTGGNSGLGAATIKALAKHNPAELWLAARTRKTADEVVAAVHATTPTANVKLLDLDLGSLDNVRSAAKTFLARAHRLDILFLNAGIAMSPAALTKDGYEDQFGTNHMGHALLTKLLMPLLLDTAAGRVAAAAPATAGTTTATTNSSSSSSNDNTTTTKPPSTDAKVNDVRIIILSSTAHYAAPSPIDYTTLRSTCANQSSISRYGTSKLANLLFGLELARRYPTVTTAIVHPGTVQTSLGRGFNANHPLLGKPVTLLLNTFVLTGVDKGVLNQLWAATATKGVVSGGYYNPVGKVAGLSATAKDERSVKALWEWTEEELAVAGEDWP